MAALDRRFDARATIAVALPIGIAGAIAIAIGIAIDPDRALASYLAMWCAAATLAFGALAFVQLGYATHARWPTVVRHLGDAIARGLPAIAILVVPLLVFARHVWPDAEQAWLARPFFAARTIVYLGAWIAIAETRARSPVTLLILGLTGTFAAFDWLMSLDPTWWSSGFGLYVLTRALAGGLALTILLAWRTSAPVTPAHFHALGRVLHAFVILWAYIAFFQAMLIQIANLPSEVTFYLARQRDGWRTVTWLLVVTGFAVPFCVLLSRRIKRHAGVMGAIAIVVVIAHVIDMYWLVIPRIAGPVPSWTDLAALAAIGGLSTSMCAWRAHGAPILPVEDPLLAEGLRYETTT